MSAAAVAHPPYTGPKLTELERVLIVIGIMLATVLEVIDVSIVNVAMPEMMGNLGVTLTEITWVSTAYIISNVIVLPLTSWLSDLFGRKMYLTYSVLLFTAASFFCGTSKSLAMLVVGRVLQGAGGAAFISTAQSTLIEIFPPHRRGQGQAMFSLGVVMAPTLGPTLGGYLTDHYAWPWIFFINIPIGIVAALMIYRFVPDSHAAGARRGADWRGIGLLAIGLGALQTMLERGESEDWFESSFIRWLAVLALVGGVLFIWWQLHRKNQNPAVDLHVLRNWNLTIGVTCGFVLGFFLYGGVFVIPQFLQHLQHHTAEQTGWLLMPGGVATMCMLPFVGRFAHRTDKRYWLVAGLGLITLSVFMLQDKLTPETPDTAIYAALVVRGMGLGLTFVPLSLVTLGSLQPRQVAQGAAIFALARQLGGSVGIAYLATLVDQRIHFHWLRVSEHVSGYSPIVQERVQQIVGAMSQRGLSPGADREAALRILNGQMLMQASLKAYMDVFHIMAFVGIIAVGLIFLFRGTRAGSGSRPGMGAAH